MNESGQWFLWTGPLRHDLPRRLFFWKSAFYPTKVPSEGQKNTKTAEFENLKILLWIAVKEFLKSKKRAKHIQFQQFV